MDKSLQNFRQQFIISKPAILQNLNEVSFEEEDLSISQEKIGQIKSLFPQTFSKALLKGKKGSKKSSIFLRVGVVFSGGPASGGHNVIVGLFEALKSLHDDSKLFGFLNGPSGIIQNSFKELSAEVLQGYKNQGGFDLLGSGRTKIETEEQLFSALNTCLSLNLDGLVIIGGDDSNTNATILSEFFLQNNCKTKVLGVPKTIDGDLQNDYVAISFGFDSACSVYSELIGNIARDAISAKKYYHFIKLIGRTASHITLECALRVQPNFVFIGEEVQREKKTLSGLVEELCDVIAKRADMGKDYGVILIPEGLVEFIPEVCVLIQELSQLLAKNPIEDKQRLASMLSSESQAFFSSLPTAIQNQLIMERDPHGNIQVSLIETELLFIELVKKELDRRKKRGAYKGKFSAIPHFFGYEGRAGFPSNFDASYCYTLGFVAALLLNEGKTGYMCFVSNLHHSVADWQIGGVPLTSLINIEIRNGKEKPVIKKALVDLNGSLFSLYKKERDTWKHNDYYKYPGPIQFYGEDWVSNRRPLILQINRKIEK